MYVPSKIAASSLLTGFQILHWDREGRQIIIQDAKALEAHLLPLVFKQSKFASFSRQLNVSRHMCIAGTVC